MFDWLKNKEYPEFWKTYHSKFETKSNRYVVVSAEMTGPRPSKDVILSFGAVGVINDNIIVSDSFEVVLLQYKYLHDNGLSNEFIIESKRAKLSEPEAVEAFVDYIGSAVLVGHRIQLEVDMINAALERMGCGHLKNEALDTEIMYTKLHDSPDKHFSIEDLCKTYKIEKGDRHSSSEDAYAIALLFLKLKSRLGIK